MLPYAVYDALTEILRGWSLLLPGVLICYCPQPSEASDFTGVSKPGGFTVSSEH